MWKFLKSLFITEDKEIIIEVEPEVEDINSNELTWNLPDFDTMSKLEIDIWARNELDLKLDRRYKKDTMIKEIITHLDKEN